MKKAVKVLLCMVLGLTVAFAATACSGTPAPAGGGNVPDNSQTDNTGNGNQTDNGNQPDNDNKPDDGNDGEQSGGSESSDVIVVYFSASTNTERVAGYIASEAGGALFELVPVNPYTSADLNWTTAGSRVNREHENESLRDIELVSETPVNWGNYTTVFIGYPIWWGIAAWPVNNFVKHNDFTGKTVIPFATSTSSGLGQSGTLLRDMAGTGNWQTGQRFGSSASESSVRSWVQGLNLAA